MPPELMSSDELTVEAVDGVPGLFTIEAPIGTLDPFHAGQILRACGEDPELIPVFNGMKARDVPIVLRQAKLPGLVIQAPRRHAASIRPRGRRHRSRQRARAPAREPGEPEPPLAAVPLKRFRADVDRWLGAA